MKAGQPAARPRRPQHRKNGVDGFARLSKARFRAEPKAAA
jgi:hypothetical protein